MHRVESWLCRVVYLSLLVCGGYAVWTSSQEHKDQIRKFLKPGWKFLGRKQDIVHDQLWSELNNLVSFGFYKWIIGYTLLSVSIRSFISSKELRCWLIACYSVICIALYAGWRAVLLFSLQHLVLCAAAWLTSSSILVWILSITWLHFHTCTAVDLFLRLTLFVLPLWNHVVGSYSLLRSTSCALVICSDLNVSHEVADSKKSDDAGRSAVGQSAPDERAKPEPRSGRYGAALIACYMSYLPLFVCGPIATYDDFRMQMDSPIRRITAGELRHIVWRLTRIVLCTVFFKLVLHYLYASALTMTPETMGVVSLWAVAGAYRISRYYFMLKFVVIWGGASVWASFDGLEVPGQPSCIGHIFLVSQRLRTFDRSFYKFQIKHIYLPLGGSRRGVVRQILASAACFLFMFVWHKCTLEAAFFVLCCYVTVQLEVVAKRVDKMPSVSQFQDKHLSPAMRSRLHTLLSMPTNMLSYLAWYSFLSNTSTTYIAFYRLIVEGFPVSPLLICAVFYALATTSKEFDLREERRKTKKD